MRIASLIGCLLCLYISCVHAQYTQDILGDSYLSRSIQMPDDYEGEVVCTLIKKPALPNVEQAILYIHGYNDYFFQKELGDSVLSHGYNFYALDLRKYGRSLLPHQDAFFCKDLSEYFADIDTALSIIREEGNDKIILMAHSTGGLITPLYLDNKKGDFPVDALILNSPFLDMNMSPVVEKVVIPFIAAIGKLFPRLTVQKSGSSSYARSLLAEYQGEWSYNTMWKKSNGHPKKAGWIRAIHKGHKKVQKGMELPCPVLVLSSDRSYSETGTEENLYSISDVVLDVKDIQNYGTRLGSKVSREVIPQGKHDLILSIKPARDHTYQVIFHWLTGLM